MPASSDAAGQATTLCGEEPERHCQPGFAADRMVRLEHGDLVLAPAVNAVGFRQLDLDAERGIAAHEFVSYAVLDEMPGKTLALGANFSVDKSEGVPLVAQLAAAGLTDRAPPAEAATEGAPADRCSTRYRDRQTGR
jgi:hypothetical protein